MVMRLRLLRPLKVASLLLITPRAEAQAADANALVAGCYALFDSAGRSAAGRFHWAPATTRLEPGGRAVKLTPERDSGSLAPLPGTYRWTITMRGDSVRVVFHSGFSGTVFLFSMSTPGDTLRGRALGNWDFGPPFTTNEGAAMAVRMACPQREGDE